jgi:hypothetical protein
MGAYFIETLAERFSSKVNHSDGCWLWIAHTDSCGYGQYKLNGRYVKAHRYSWAHFNGEIPDGLHVLHKCDTPACVNPAHLFTGTHSDNMRDMWEKRRHAIPKVRGELNPMSKLTQTKVDEIRSLYQRGVTGEFSLKGLSLCFGVSKSLIGLIVNYKVWPLVA